MKTVIKLIAAAGLVALGSCASSNRGNTSRARFLDQVWVSPAVRGKTLYEAYPKVYFAPVKVDRLKQQDWWTSQSARTQADLAKDARHLAKYTGNALRSAAANYPAKRVQVVNGPGPGTLVVDCAITELVPAKAFWNSATTAAGFVVPGAGLLGTFGKGSIAFEGRLRDGGTGKVLATFRTRKSDKMAVINTAAYTWYRGSEGNIDELAQQTARLLNTPKGTVVESGEPITLISY